ncbi:acyltransferase [Burkholderia sp. Ac-20345]|uniref:acyltransferase family protein n=1 Tax=Burkholderia sp. Ac-20345 TaxID=2703891 RepID=UPI00197B24FE|nr:acyltransferase [Burkholderia sp. Ac-20345]MBN3777766.1 acyltransferase [Burkholderia sp. Ac-20345]
MSTLFAEAHSLPRTNNSRAGIKMKISSLEGLRGAAALLVVIFHMQFMWHGMRWLQGGYLAVDLFFVLSGFVIATTYSERMTDGLAWRIFMIRRFGRLYPTQLVASIALFALLNGSALLSGGMLAARSSLPSPTELFAVFTMSQGLPLYGHLVGLPVTWSTSCEFFVYMLFGALCLALRGRARVATFVALAAFGYGVAVAASIGSASCISAGGCFNLLFDYGWARCLAGFFLGALIAHCRTTRAVVELTRPLTQCLALALAMMVIVVSARDYKGMSLSVASFAAPFVFALLVAALSSDQGPVARLFSLRVFQWLGAVSYSVYLVHDVFRPLLDYFASRATSPVLIGGSFVLVSYGTAQILHTRVEQPWRARIYAWSDSLREKGRSVAIE